MGVVWFLFNFIVESFSAVTEDMQGDEGEALQAGESRNMIDMNAVQARAAIEMLGDRGAKEPSFERRFQYTARHAEREQVW